MSKLLITLVATPLALISTYSLAQGSTGTTYAAQPRAAAVQTPSQADTKPADTKSFENARLSLVQAVKVAHAEMQGRILGVRFEMWHGQPTYLVRIYTSRSLPAVWQRRINADTALPIGQPEMIWSYEWNPRLRGNIVALRHVHTPLGQVVKKAAKTTSGDVIMAAVRTLPDGRPAYRLDVVKNDHSRVLTIGPQSV